MISDISKKNELKLIGIARVSLEKLLLDYNENIKELTAEILGGINS